MRKKRNKSKKVQLTLTRITIWEIEVAPFSDPSDASTNLSSPSQHPYIEVGMVMMLNKRVTSPRSGGAPSLHLEKIRKLPS
jgi:hypothetical protein